MINACGTDNEISSDILVIHNEDGTVTTGTLASETIPVKDGERIQAFDVNGRTLFDAGVVFKDVVQTLPQTTLTLTGTIVADQMFVVNLDTDTNENNGYTFTFGPYRATSADAAAANPL